MRVFSPIAGTQLNLKPKGVEQRTIGPCRQGFAPMIVAFVRVLHALDLKGLCTSLALGNLTLDTGFPTSLTFGDFHNIAPRLEFLDRVNERLE